MAYRSNRFLRREEVSDRLLQQRRLKVVFDSLVMPAGQKNRIEHLEQLTEALARFLENPGLRHQCATNGRQRVSDEFNLGTETDRLVTVIRGRLSGAAVQTRPEVVDSSPSR